MVEGAVRGSGVLLPTPFIFLKEDRVLKGARVRIGAKNREKWARGLTEGFQQGAALTT